MNPQIIHVNTGRPYDIFAGRAILDDTGALLAKTTSSRKAAVITDSTVSSLYGARVIKSLEAAGFTVKLHAFPAGEQSKTPETLLQIYAFLSAFDMTRQDTVVALGGGVPGDVAGFAAATYMRGIDFIQIPTTLLAQVDSSIGGKTAIDLKEGKNLVGAFWQPRLVVCDPDTLKTLDARIFADGMGEVIKHACIRDSGLFALLAGGSPMDENFICRNINIKRVVVEQDERERGERMLLNFGHTFGHAIEKYFHYTQYSHGEGVAMGMVQMARFGESLSLTAPGTANKIISLLKKYDLPYELPAPAYALAQAAANDKKRSGDNLNLVMLSQIGEAFIYKIPVHTFIDSFKGANSIA